MHTLRRTPVEHHALHRLQHTRPEYGMIWEL